MRACSSAFVLCSRIKRLWALIFADCSLILRAWRWIWAFIFSATCLDQVNTRFISFIAARRRVISSSGVSGVSGLLRSRIMRSLTTSGIRAFAGSRRSARKPRAACV
jgi:hypothetical protein